MFDSFSMRARQVVFAARFKAGERGAKMIDTDDFLVGLILEDQRVVAESIFPKIHKGQGTVVSKAPSHIPFFPSKIAEDLLAKLESRLPQSQPVATNAEMPVSPSLKRVFDSAKGFQTRFQHSQIEPLHLLAAILTEESSEAVKLLQGSGITQTGAPYARRWHGGLAEATRVPTIFTSSPGSGNRTSPVLGLHISGNRVWT